MKIAMKAVLGFALLGFTGCFDLATGIRSTTTTGSASQTLVQAVDACGGRAVDFVLDEEHRIRIRCFPAERHEILARILESVKAQKSWDVPAPLQGTGENYRGPDTASPMATLRGVGSIVDGAEYERSGLPIPYECEAAGGAIPVACHGSDVIVLLKEFWNVAARSELLAESILVHQAYHLANLRQPPAPTAPATKEHVCPRAALPPVSDYEPEAASAAADRRPLQRGPHMAQLVYLAQRLKQLKATTQNFGAPCRNLSEARGAGLALAATGFFTGPKDGDYCSTASVFHKDWFANTTYVPAISCVAETPGLSASPVIIDTTLASGATVVRTIRVTNTGNAEGEYSVTVGSLAHDLNGSPTSPEGYAYDGQALFSVDTPFRLAPGAYKDVPIKAAVPAGRTGGAYATMYVAVKPVAPTQATSTVVITIRLGILLEVILPGEVRKSVEVGTVTAAQSAPGGAVVFGVPITNRGNVHVPVGGTVTVKDAGGTEVGKVYLWSGNVFPELTRVYSGQWTPPVGMAPGTYSYSIVLNSPGLTLPTQTGSLTIQ